MLMPARPLPGTAVDPRFPDADGRPMGDTDFHSDALIWLREGLQDHFADDPTWYVATNIILYWDYDNPKNRRDPDVLVARGVAGNHRRRSFRVWEEGVLPCTLFEIASKKTWRQDVGEKIGLYAAVGIPEYFLFDPEGKYLDPILQGFRRQKGAYVPMKPAKDGSLTSRQLGLRLVPEGVLLRLIDLRTGQPVLTRTERAEQERQRAEELAAEVARLKAELRRHKRSKG
jgi:Uma2 family endonuclease